MGIIHLTIKAVRKQPFILILIGVLMMAAAVINAFIPVMAMIVGIIQISGGNIFESMLSVMQMMIDPGILPTLLITLAVLTVLVAVVGALLLPGYLRVVDDGIADGKKKNGLFAEGMKTSFFRFFLMLVKTVVFAAFLIAFLLVAAVPAIIVTRAALTSKPDLMLVAIFIDIITTGVFFMCLSFFKSYIYMWFIAASKGEEKPFAKGKAVADRQFWGLAFTLLLFDIIFALVLYFIYLNDNQIFRYVSGWVFTTAYFTTLAVYLLHVYSGVHDIESQTE